MSAPGSNPQRVYTPLYRAIPAPLTGMFLAGLEGVTESVIAQLELSSQFCTKHAFALVAALQREREFLTEFIDFQDPGPPPFPDLGPRERLNLATACCMKRPLCVVICNANGQVAAGREYKRVEQTRLMRTRAEMEAHIVALKRRYFAGNVPPSRP